MFKIELIPEPRAVRDRIMPICVTPAAYITPDLHPGARHYRVSAVHDIVPLLDPIGRYRARHQTYPVKWNPADPRCAHGLQCKSYDETWDLIGRAYFRHLNGGEK